jgi:predicted  nucleic acid-binding Zn-ribbon protein
MHKHICLYCGKEFESRRVVAGFCPGKSTCRAGYYKRQKREQAAADKLKAEAGADAMLATLRQVDPKAAALVDRLRDLAGAECVGLAIKAGLQLNAALAKVEGLPMK